VLVAHWLTRSFISYVASIAPALLFEQTLNAVSL
jgi:hypothetical protein